MLKEDLLVSVLMPDDWSEWHDAGGTCWFAFAVIASVDPQLFCLANCYFFIFVYGVRSWHLVKLDVDEVKAGPLSRLIPYNLPVLLLQPGFVIVIIHFFESE